MRSKKPLTFARAVHIGRRCTRRQHGFSIVELLVVLGVIALLLALILPAIQQSRESARRLKCQNNLKQIGIALHSYHDTHKCFPPGYSPGPVNVDGTWPHHYSGYSWATHILPYLDQASLFGELAVNSKSLEARLFEPDAANLVQTQLSVFQCTSDLAGDTFETAPMNPKLRPLNRAPGNGLDGPAVFGASSSYVGNSGYFEVYHPAAPTSDIYVASYQKKTRPNNGLFFTGSHVRIADISDGTSQTLAIGERAWYSGSSMWVGSSNVRGALPGGAGVCLGRVFWRINELPDPPGILITPGNKEWIRGGGTAREAFSSYHAGGANFLLADGSVRFLSEFMESRPTTSASADVTEPVLNSHLLGVFQLLGIRNDGEAPSGF